ncbi:class I SAM-dependent methyltransferase [Muricauda sp. JGD-17]|uniref:Class I SAM-dependent methyltransferase n=1 Tax=Flagellimonas ochracea TaxID=2696472 RepID=A0A964WX63_9FLAO|nr:class I SAM-dependent methyltransferase [Allomuricauda ochracea]
MNKLLLNTGVQYFIKNFSESDTLSVLLKKPIFEGISQKELVAQLEARKKCKEKLPTWFNTENIYYPNKLNIEQSSSEITAQYKADLIEGKSLLDLTGGFGVDTYYFAKKINRVVHVELNPDLSAIAAHNFNVLGSENVTCVSNDGIAFLNQTKNSFDWIYVDPSRRDDVKGKVFLLKDCLPNLPQQLPLIFKHTENVLVKTSPLLDIKRVISELSFVKEVHVVALRNEVKELLFTLERDYLGSVVIKAVNLRVKNNVEFSFIWEEEAAAKINMGIPDQYLYEPNAAILKSGGFKLVGEKFGVKKLHHHSHLYTASERIDFPGRRFKIVQVHPYSKSHLKHLEKKKANITKRNFPISVAAIRKKHKIKDGGEIYLFFTTDLNDDLIVLECNKI